MTFRRAFTLIELLVVITIIAILVGLLVAGTAALRENLKKTKTRAIMGGVVNALRIRSADIGGFPSPAEHPMAGSAEIGASGRPAFIRAADGSSVATSGEALRVQVPSWVATSARNRILMDDDRYIGASTSAASPLPHMVGLPRSHCGILAAGNPVVTRWRNLPTLETRYRDSSTGLLKTPYDGTVYPDLEFLYAPTLTDGDTVEDASARFLTTCLGENGYKELTDLGGILSETTGSLLLDDRLRLDSRAEVATSPNWQPGMVLVGGTWTAYRQRGTGIYDAWGREILYRLTPEGAPVMTSAGPDGCFVWTPGNNGMVDSDPGATTPGGDDSDGSKDNLSLDGRE